METSFVSGNDLVPTRQRVITWTDDAQVYMVTMSLKKKRAIEEEDEDISLKIY